MNGKYTVTKTSNYDTIGQPTTRSVKMQKSRFCVDYSYIFAQERLTKMTMNKRQKEYIALYLFVFGAILLFGVLARKFVLVKGYDEFNAAVGFFATVVVLSALYISLQMTLNELLLPRMEKFLMRFPAFQKLEEVVVVAEQERASQAKLERVLDYSKQTMAAYMSKAELDCLCGHITEYSLGDTPREVSPVSVDSALKSIDLMHFGWNIGKAFGK